MGLLTRTFDWSTTSIGPPSGWSQSLRIQVGLVLNCRFPMLLMWGKDLVQFYNDAFRPSLGYSGKHPIALGQTAEICWAEIWSITKPLLDKVTGGGGGHWSEDLLLPIYRNGKIEDAYWTFSYSPAMDDDGSIAGVIVVCHETTEKIVSVNKLIEREKEFMNLVLQAPVGLCILKSDPLTVSLVNDQFLRLIGVERDDFEYRSPWETVPQVREQYEPVLLQVIQTGQTFTGMENSVELNREGKLEVLYINFVCEPVKDADGIVTHIMILAIEITEQVKARRKIEESEALLQERVKERTKELERANERLATMNRELEHFTFAASHDMQEPLRKVNTFSAFLLEHHQDQLDATAKEYLGKIGTSVRRMKNMIDDLLNYSQQTGEGQQLAPVDLNRIAADIETDLELLIQQKKARIHREQLPRLFARPAQMNQLFFNLYNNALKFSKPDAPVEITMQTQAPGEDDLRRLEPVHREKTYIRISFADNGIGFEQQYAEQIFHPFKRLHGKNEYEGSGIGLGLCKKIVDSYQGAIWAESSLGEGAVFYVLLPLA